MEVNVKVELLPVGTQALKKIDPKFCTDLFQTLGLWRLYFFSVLYFLIIPWVRFFFFLLNFFWLLERGIYVLLLDWLESKLDVTARTPGFFRSLSLAFIMSRVVISPELTRMGECVDKKKKIKLAQIQVICF